jgi:hypothetical protein
MILCIWVKTGKGASLQLILGHQLMILESAGSCTATGLCVPWTPRNPTSQINYTVCTARAVVILENQLGRKKFSPEELSCDWGSDPSSLKYWMIHDLYLLINTNKIMYYFNLKKTHF